MVVGVEDEEFGERVAAAIVPKPNKSKLKIEELRADLRESLPGYQMPTLLRIVSGIPKNSTGKVMKKALRSQIFPPEGHAEIQKWQRESAKL
jgi:malonyl-CoA/methylmalonyl-CoA synthetase